jgi:DNA-binding transcriptional LysR family regulator
LVIATSFTGGFRTGVKIERQHVTQAAQALNLAQSAASHAIAALEARYETKLFDRVGRRIELTDVGAAFLAEARAILAQVNRAEIALTEFGTLERGTLTVQASQTIASYWLPRYLVAFRRSHPQIDVRLTIGNTAQVAEAIETGAAELGFVEGLVEKEELISTRVALDQLVLVVGNDHPWADGMTPSADDLVESEWVLRERGSGTRAVFEKVLQNLGIEPGRLRVSLELPSNEAVRGAVEAGMGATAISASVAAASIENGLLPQREFHVLHHRQRTRSRVAEVLLASLDRPGKPKTRAAKPSRKSAQDE